MSRPIEVLVGAVKLAAPPSVLRAGGQANLVPFDTLGKGEIVLPRGRKCRRVTWSGVHFGASAGRQPWAAVGYLPPAAASATLFKYMEEGEEVTFVATGYGASLQVYVESYEDSYGRGSGYGNCEYQIALVEARDLTSDDDRQRGTSASSRSVRAAGQTSGDVYVTRAGQTWAAVAGAAVGDEGQWRTLRDANAAQPWVDDDPLPAGKPVRVPGGARTG